MRRTICAARSRSCSRTRDPNRSQVANMRARISARCSGSCIKHRRSDRELKQANERIRPRAISRSRPGPRAAGLAEAELDAGETEAAAVASAESSLTRAQVLPAEHYSVATPLFALARAELAANRTPMPKRFARRSPCGRPCCRRDPRILEIKVALVVALEGRAGRPPRGSSGRSSRRASAPCTRPTRTSSASACRPPDGRGGVQARLASPGRRPTISLSEFSRRLRLYRYRRSQRYNDREI